MSRQARIGVTLIPVVFWGLIIFIGLTTTARGSEPAGGAFAQRAGLLLQGATETEPNDTLDTADAIDVNLTMRGVILTTQTDDIDWYRLILSDTDLGRNFQATLEEVLPDADYQLELNLYDAGGSLVKTASSGSTTLVDWTSNVITYYLRVRATEFDVPNAPGDLDYNLTIVRFATTPTPSPTATPVPWDDCEINDNIDGAWPGGPCLLAVGIEETDLNFVPATGQPAPNNDYFTFLAKAGHVYRVTTSVAGGADTEMWLYDPSNAQIAYDDDGGDGYGSRIERTLGDGYYKMLVRDRNVSASPSTAQTYDIVVEDLTPSTPTPTPTGTPGTPTVTPTPLSIPGQPDAFEPNYDFSRAALIGLDTKYTNLNFVPWSGTQQDNDFYKLWVVAGKLYTCETLELGTATNTNMILYSAANFQSGFAGNDDVVPFDPADPYRSRITFFSSYNGYLYILLGQVGAAQVLPEEWADLSYSLKCFIEQPGTATPTPTSAFVPPPDQPSATPQPTLPSDAPTALPTATPAQLVVVPMTTPTPPPPPAATTPAPELFVIEVLLYFDQNSNAQSDPQEGVSDVLVRAFDALTGEMLSIDYTDEMGYLRFTVPGSGPIHVNVPFFGFDQIVTQSNSSIQIRIAPRP